MSRLENRGGKQGKRDWFMGKGYTNTLTLPATTDNRLVEMVKMKLEDQEKGTKCKTLVLSDGGTPVYSGLIQSDPFKKEKCHRIDCLMCSNSNTNCKCYISCVGYRVSCNRVPCIDPNGGEDSSPSIANYEGETSHTACTRSKQHMEKYLGSAKARKVSFMYFKPE